MDNLKKSLEGLIRGEIAAYEELMYGLLLSGLAMQMTGNSRPASGSEHHMAHFWEMAVINDEAGRNRRNASESERNCWSSGSWL